SEPASATACSTLSLHDALPISRLRQSLILVSQCGHQEVPDQVGLFLAVAAGADNLVGGQHQWVACIGSKECIGVNNHVVALGGELHDLQRLPNGFFIQLGWALAEFDVGNAQAGVSCVRVLNVGDAAVNLLFLGGNTGRAVSTFAHVGWEVGAFAFPLAGGSR